MPSRQMVTLWTAKITVTSSGGCPTRTITDTSTITLKGEGLIPAAMATLQLPPGNPRRGTTGGGKQGRGLPESRRPLHLPTGNDRAEGHGWVRFPLLLTGRVALLLHEPAHHHLGVLVLRDLDVGEERLLGLVAGDGHDHEGGEAALVHVGGEAPSRRVR